MLNIQQVLITGAAGIVGSLIRPLASKRYPSVLLTDLNPITELAPNEHFVQGDIQDAAFVESLLRQTDAVVHLAGLVGPDFSFDEVMGANVNGTYQLLQAASQAGVTQFVYASSHHAVGFLPRGARIDEQTPHRPDSFYGVSKAFGETLSTYYADKHGMNILSIRIGFVGEQVIDERRLHTWCSARDLFQLIEIGLGDANLGYQVVYGVSDNPQPFFENHVAESMGYQPLDRALEHVIDPAITQEAPDLTQLQNRLVGGYFGARGFRGDENRLKQASD